MPHKQLLLLLALNIVYSEFIFAQKEWCSGFRNSRRMRLSPDFGMEHLGFRCVKDIK